MILMSEYFINHPKLGNSNYVVYNYLFWDEGFRINISI